MEATHRRVREIFTGDHQYLVPVFQRHYSWTRIQWEYLWEDIVGLNEDFEPDQEHFMGSLVCVPLRITPGDVIRWGIIDGQQRLTTIQIILCAIRDIALEKRQEDFANEIQEKYIIDRHRQSAKRYKVVPRPADYKYFTSLAEKLELEGYSTIYNAYHYYKNILSVLPQDNNFEALKQIFNIVTTQLTLVFIRLGEKDNQYGIFETLNTRGLELEESDLIRNYIFMHVPFEEQNDFDGGPWNEFESIFKRSDHLVGINITEFYRDYLMSLGKYVRKNEIYLQFKKLNNLRDLSPNMLVNNLIRKANFYSWILRPTTMPDSQLSETVKRLKELDISTSYPLILHLLDRYESGELTRNDLLELFSMLESFIIRRAVTGFSSKGYSKMFPAAVGGVDIKNSIMRFFINKGWPDDDSFKNLFKSVQMYYGVDGKYRFILEAIEKSYGHQEPASLQNVTVEHIMPQTIDESDSNGQDWIRILGPEWKRIHSTKLHTIGNLTLTAYNPELSNKSFAEKKQWYTNSNLELNKYFRNVDTWDEAAIDARAEHLSNLAMHIWKR